MEYLTRRKNFAAIAYLLGGAGFAAAQNRKPIQQPNMQAALEHLRQAKESLQKAEHNKGGHRDRAIQFVDQAIGEVNAGIEYDLHQYESQHH